LSKTGDLAPFKQKQGPWVWKDTYIFVVDCNKRVIAAHPIKPELVGQDYASVKDAKGKEIPSRKVGAMQRKGLPASGSNIGGRSPARRRVPAS